ncbi:unnamed protein product [Diatraea saccharalis]|uniref:Elongator complex protein 4 n=1 Tax=Diatraea saccharalis TaxID=40085 RepID=A0A9N9WHF1_9NEOP|nr:unnamed protein product [Diatraea saccharalis]
MSSFHKISDSRISINGTKIKNNLLFISSGIPSLDHIIGGGLPAGAIFVVEEDVLGSYSKILCKYFLAEGIVSKHALFLASADDDPQETVKALPQPCDVPMDNETTKITEDIDRMKIAWRYEGLSQVDSSFGNNSTFGHHFDLSKHIDENTIKSSNISYCYLEPSENNNVDGFRNCLYSNLVHNIKNIVKKYKNNKSEDKNILRICIQALGSPIWMAMDCEDGCHDSYGLDLIKFMYCLRILLRDTNATAFITMPSHLFEDDHIMKRLLYSVDNAVRLESFTGSSKETNPVYKDYHGLFHITKLSALYSMVPYIPPSIDLAFKLKRKKFVIEKLHLPPELQESSEREQDDITSTPYTCGGFKKKDIDF